MTCPARGRTASIARIIGASARRPLLDHPLRRRARRVGRGLARQAPLDAIPDLSDVQVIVFTEWMGQSPDLVEDQVTYPISSRAHLRAEGAGRARSIDVRDVVRQRHLRRRHGHLLGAQPRPRVPELRPRQAARRGSIRSSGPTRPASAGSSSTRSSTRRGKHDLAGAALAPGLEPALRARQRPRRRRGRERRRLRQAVPGQRRSDEAPRATASTMDDVVKAVRASNQEVGGRVIEMGGHEQIIRGRGYVKTPDDIGRRPDQGRARHPGPGHGRGARQHRPRHPPRALGAQRRRRSARRHRRSCATARTR